MREVAEECYEMSTANATALALDAELYAAFRALSDSRAVRTPADSVRYLNKTLEKFRRSGVDQVQLFATTPPLSHALPPTPATSHLASPRCLYARPQAAPCTCPACVVRSRMPTAQRCAR